MVDIVNRAVQRALQDAKTEQRRDREQAESDAARTEQPADTPQENR